jgi:hypothetical protein
VTIEGATLKGSNVNSTIDHGAILVYSGQPGFQPDDISIAGANIANTRANAPFQVAVIASSNATVGHVRMHDIHILGGGRSFWTNVHGSQCRNTAWTVDGMLIPDR